MSVTCLVESIKAALRYLLVAAAAAAFLAMPSRSIAATVTVDWSTPSQGVTTDRTFASNEEMNGHLTAGALDPKYAADLKWIGFHFLRLHAGTVEEWTTNNAWDPKIIGAELNSPYIRSVGDTNIVITIDTVPKWCRNSDKSINDTEFAAFCAQLVSISNKQLGHHVRYWECMNEPDSWPDLSNDWLHLFRIYNTCAAAMKAVDPTIKIGGPTISWYNDKLADQFLTNCWKNVDFLSWHGYLTGKSLVPPLSGPGIYKQIMLNLPRFDQEIVQAKATIAGHRAHGFSDGHPIPTDYDEFNMCYDWTATGWGQDGYVGAAFFAAALTHMAHAKVDWSANWSAKDGYFGLIDMNDKVRLPAYVYRFANHYLIGPMALISSSDPDIECLAVDGGAHSAQRHAFLLTNKYYGTTIVKLDHGLCRTGESAHITTIDKTGVHTTNRIIPSKSMILTMPGLSVAMITTP